MSILSVAARVAARTAAMEHESLEKPQTEYSARVEIIFSADFEGSVAKSVLVKKIESEIVNALKSSVEIVSRELRLEPGKVLVKPLRIEVAMNDQASYGEESGEDTQEQ